MHDESEALAVALTGRSARSRGLGARRCVKWGRHLCALAAHEVPDQCRRVAAREQVQKAPEGADQTVAQCCVGDQRRLDAQNRAVGERRRDADVLDIE